MTANSLIDTLFRHGIGYDPLARFAETLTNVGNFPPHNIVKLDDNHYRLTLAVAGYHKDEIHMTLHNGTLKIIGKSTDDSAGEYLYRGIGLRNFDREFKLGEHVKIIGASLGDGLLVVDMSRELPEQLQPKTIQIKG